MSQNYFMVTSALWYFGLLCVNGRYRCFIMCYKRSGIRIFIKQMKIIQLTLICRFIVIQNSVMKYITRIGQKTGILKTSKNVQTIAIVVDFVMAYQNLNSGSRLMKGRNSSLLRDGKVGPSGSSAEKGEEKQLVIDDSDKAAKELTRI